MSPPIPILVFILPGNTPTNILYWSDVRPIDLSTSGRHRMCNTARCWTDVGCILKNHIGPISCRLAFPCRPDIGFLPRSDISRRHCAMCNVGPISDVQHGSMSNRCRLPIKQPYWSDVESPCTSVSAPHQLLTLVGFQ